MTDYYEQIKYIVAPDIYHLETRVNAFLASPANSDWVLRGDTQVFGHEMFVQAFTTIMRRT